MPEIHNPNCDGGHCKAAAGQVRRLPHGADPHHGASILCRDCYEHEAAYRRERGWDTPPWESLEVYAGA
jgi:hypothetical protein